VKIQLKREEVNPGNEGSFGRHGTRLLNAAFWRKEEVMKYYSDKKRIITANQIISTKNNSRILLSAGMGEW